MRFNYLFASILLILFCFSCAKNNQYQQDNTNNINDLTARSEVQKWTGNPNALGCDVYRPVVMVHGFLASGDTWAKFAQYFTSNGYCNRQMYAFTF